jgi:4-hydroxy-2-oxoheptanedioate aldolase
MNVPPVGIFQNLPLPMVSRYLAQLGWDWIILDMQHGCFNFETVYECIHTIRTCGAKPFVRVNIGGTSEINRVLDLGAAGVVVPMVNSRAEAEAAARAAKYPPQGGRSIGGDPWYHYGRSYPVEANRQTILLAQIEHIDAANAVGEILSVDGVDGCFVGPTDLALSMGLSHVGFETDDRHRAAIQRTVDVCLSLGKIAASNCYNLADAGEKLAQGYNWITFRSDMDLFLGSAQSLLNDLRQVTAASMEAPAR